MIEIKDEKIVEMLAILAKCNFQKLITENVNGVKESFVFIARKYRELGHQGRIYFVVIRNFRDQVAFLNPDNVLLIKDEWYADFILQKIKEFVLELSLRD